MTLGPPEHLSPSHDVSEFDCGNAILDDWLRKRALENEMAGASRTYVVSDGTKVRAYYSLAVGSIDRTEAPGRLRRNMPAVPPVMILGRLAIDRRLHGMGVGSGLLKDALVRTLNAAEIVGIRAVLVHAIDAEAAKFYRRRGFLDSPVAPLVLTLPLETMRSALSGSGQ